ncbi:MAG: hypothetical protein IPM58_10110 [Nitrospira sp.]|nr:hypothetical protein [Nitrospira sp.]
MTALLPRGAEFFNKVDNFTPPRDQQGANLLKHTDFIHAPLPEPIEQLRIQEWKQYNKYGASCTSWFLLLAKTSLQRVIRFEEFPSWSPDSANNPIKEKASAIIKEGEGNA